MKRKYIIKFPLNGVSKDISNLLFFCSTFISLEKFSLKLKKEIGLNKYLNFPFIVSSFVNIMFSFLFILFIL